MHQFLETFNFQPNEKIGSLGCGGGIWEIGLGVLLGNLNFVLMDINPEILNEEEVQAAVGYWEKHYSKLNTSRFQVIINTPQKIPLPDQSLDKLILSNAFHEFSEQAAMLQEIRRVMKENGSVFVEEQIAQFSGERHEGCGKPLFTASELKQVFEKAGFTLTQAVPSSEIAQLFTFSVAMIIVRSPQTPEEWKAYYQLRFDVLRDPWNQPPGSERLADEDQVIHAAAFGEGGKILGVARLQTNEPGVGQVRCVAVSTAAQGKGVGKKLMSYLEALALGQGLTEIILEARENAVPFYQSIGYEITKTSYLLFNEIQHYTMRKALV
ncbi:GNAT family N-acetyltransferase [Siphonobacter sp. SORGH_AS_1065]|uniref:GNAT family N-acetyltransferase n=1 Tax=Siphonobacter sp. SORGH_AS_1065 TaxID=3041795 RepID=UPI0027889F9F|nr:GNAT family N-acetyltransferase [Siphonobacter sp. SORGH_AS_1065]MDQ1088070.1 ribosomal protein S18 acetylase RimI-like enzyme [Siphonobacter sp. SORGH_AS_1065]